MNSIFPAMKASKIPFDRFDPQSRLVFFTGAGISAESGIATFRDPQGLWSKYDPMKLASPAGFEADPELVLSWYAHRREMVARAQPNLGHQFITDFQKLFQHSVVITQNVDGLHEKAGNQHIYELHGNIHRHKCHRCRKVHNLEDHQMRALYTCDCGGLIRPDVVWFGENLDSETLQAAFEAARTCDLMFMVGTSAQIYPAAQLPYEAQARGAFVIEINPEATPFTVVTDLYIQGEAGKVMPQLYEEFNAQLN